MNLRYRNLPLNFCVATLLFLSLRCAPGYGTYLQELDATQLITQPAVNLVQDEYPGKFSVSGWATTYRTNTLRTRMGMHSNVTPAGTYWVDTVIDGDIRSIREEPFNTIPYTEEDMQWTPPATQFGLNARLAATSNIAVIAGVQHASLSGPLQWGFNGGLSYYSEGPELSIRLEIGASTKIIHFRAQAIRYHSANEILGQDGYELAFSNPDDVAHVWNGYTAVTINTRKLNAAPLLFFLQATIIKATFIVLPIGTSDDVTFGTTTVNLMPGLGYVISPQVTFIGGIQFRDLGKVLNGDQFSPIPFLQMEYGF